MTITLELPDNLAAALAREATRAGRGIEDYALDVLARTVLSIEPDRPRTGAELLAIWEREGLIGIGSDIEDPVQYARELRERNQRRGRA